MDHPILFLLTPRALRGYYLSLRVVRLPSVLSHDSSFNCHPRSRRDSGEDVEAGGSVGVDQVPELGGVGFAGGFGLIEPEVYQGPCRKGLPADADDSRGGVS